MRSLSTSQLWPIFLRGLAIFVVVVLVLAVRVVLSSRAELAQGDQLRSQGQVDAAVFHYRRAASWYTPGSPFSSAGLGRLWEIGQEAETHDDTELALACYRSMRSSILAARSLYTPHARRLREANQRIAVLMSGLSPPPMDLGKGQHRVRDEHYELLTHVDEPNRIWALLMMFGFITWVTGAVAFASNAIDQEDRLVPQRVRLWGTVALIGFGMFVLGLSFA